MRKDFTANLARLTIAVSAMIFLFFGCYGLFAPDSLAALIGWIPEHSDAIVEIRAMYGGLELGAGFLLLYCLFDKDRITWAGLAVISQSFS